MRLSGPLALLGRRGEQEPASSLEHRRHLGDELCLHNRLGGETSVPTPPRHRRHDRRTRTLRPAGTRQRPPGNRARNAAIMLGEASTPQTVKPSSTMAWEIGTPDPQPRSRTVAPLGSVFVHARTAEAPTDERKRPEMNPFATASYPFEGSVESVSAMSRASFDCQTRAASGTSYRRTTIPWEKFRSAQA